MIENNNVSKMPSSGEFINIVKYIGVASVNVLAINPNNDRLRKCGWDIAEDAEEPKYTMMVERDGKQVKSARVRFLVQIQDFEDKPIIPLDFWIRPDISINKDNTKCKIIDSYGRTAWGTKDEIKSHAVPQYTSGPANISTSYRPCHYGEEELVTFLMKYLNVTPLHIFDSSKQRFVESKNPGKLTIDNWQALCNGDVKELVEYVALQPDNRVKVVLGVHSTDNNRTYQTFLNTGYISNNILPDRNTGEYPRARKLIDKYLDGRVDSQHSFSASPVKEWRETATAVEDTVVNLFDDPKTDADTFDDLPF